MKLQRCALLVDGVEIADNVILCNTRSSRRKGLLGKSELGAKEGIIMDVPGVQKYLAGYWNSIHMVGMKFPISVAWVGGDGKIVHSCLAKPQGAMGVFFPKLYSSPVPAVYIVELHPSQLAVLVVGATVCWRVF